MPRQSRGKTKRRKTDAPGLARRSRSARQAGMADEPAWSRGFERWPMVLLTRDAQPVKPEIVAPLWQRPFVAGDALAFYLRKLVLPGLGGITLQPRHGARDAARPGGGGGAVRRGAAPGPPLGVGAERPETGT